MVCSNLNFNEELDARKQRPLSIQVPVAEPIKTEQAVLIPEWTAVQVRQDNNRINRRNRLQNCTVVLAGIGVGSVIAHVDHGLHHLNPSITMSICFALLGLNSQKQQSASQTKNKMAHMVIALGLLATINFFAHRIIKSEVHPLPHTVNANKPHHL